MEFLNVNALFIGTLILLGTIVAYMFAYRISFNCRFALAEPIAFDEFLLRCKHSESRLSISSELGWVSRLYKESHGNETVFREKLEILSNMATKYLAWIYQLIKAAVGVGFMGTLVGVMGKGEGVDVDLILSLALPTTLLGIVIQVKGALFQQLIAGKKTKDLLAQIQSTRGALQIRREKQFVHSLINTSKATEVSQAPEKSRTKASQTAPKSQTTRLNGEPSKQSSERNGAAITSPTKPR